MKQKSCFWEFSHYTILSVLGMLGVSCYILADTFFVSKGLGTNGLAALNLAIPVYNFIHGTGLMLGMGGATKFSVCKSQNRKESVDCIYTNTVYLAVLFAVIFVLTGTFLSEQIASVLGADADILEMTTTYLRWLLLFSPAFLMNDVFLCFVRNDGSPQISTTAMMLGSFANIVLDYIFIFPMQMGIFGAVFATGLSPVISISVMLLYRIKKKNSFHLMKTKMRTDIIRQELSLGVPSLIAQVSAGIVMIIFNMIILRLEGNTGVAAYGVIANISIVIVAIYTGIAQGIQPLISNFYGVGDERQIRMVLRYAMAVMAVFSIVVYLLTFLFAQPVTNIFNHENNVRMQQIAVEGLKLYFTSNIFVGYNTILAVYFTSIEKALPAQVLSILRGFVLIVPMAFVLSVLWGMMGVWLAYPLTELLTALAGAAIYKCKKSR
ncbi:MATE family efflux transporter [Faecalimonas umbilicata]|nr:MATE family efflux transporter [Faecalimonas umbilicata]